MEEAPAAIVVVLAPVPCLGAAPGAASVPGAAPAVNALHGMASAAVDATGVLTDALGMDVRGVAGPSFNGSSSSQGAGGLVLFKSAPGEPATETHKPNAAHATRSDARACIATAALRRRRGWAWGDVRGVIFPFDDQELLRIMQRLVSSRSDPPEHLDAIALSRVLDEQGMAHGGRIERGMGSRPDQRSWEER